MESAIDELAHAAGQDPLAYRRLLLKTEPRHLGVLNLAAERFGWGRKAAPGRGQGIAVHQSFGSFCAQAVEISIEHDEIRVHRVVCAIDCGIPVNPDNIKAQMEGAIVFGLSAALFGQISIKEGRVQQSNFHDYRVLRMNEMPQIEVHVLPSTEGPGGVGEPATPPVAPAVANALFALTGQRLRELPLRLSSRA
jgi:isoquinoline 1-oxidoreductase beta subunit